MKQPEWVSNTVPRHDEAVGVRDSHIERQPAMTGI